MLASTPSGASPTTTAVPPQRIASQASRMVSGRPTTSKAKSAPSTVSARIASTALPADVASTTCVAPCARASSSFSGTRSTAMIGEAPARRAAAITWRPTPPYPRTATASPPWTFATFATAPAPVTTPQPRSAACHSGSSSGIRTAPPAATTVYSEKHAVRRPCWSVVPSGRRRRLVPSMSIPVTPCSATTSQRFGFPARQYRHERHAGTKHSATWSPGATCVSSEPTPSHPPAPRGPGGRATSRDRGRRPRGGRPNGTRRRRRCEREPRSPSADRARPPRPRRAGPGDGEPRRVCASADPVLLQRVEVRNHAQPRTGRRSDRPVVADLDRRRQQPVPALRRPARRVVRNLEIRRLRERERGVQVRQQAVPVRPRVRAPRRARLLRQRRHAACALDPTAEDHVDLHDVHAAREDEGARLRFGAHHLAGRDAQARAAAELGVRVEILGRQGLLEPVHVETLELPRELEDFRRRPPAREIARHAPCLVRVDHDLEPRADGLANRCDHGEGGG